MPSGKQERFVVAFDFGLKHIGVAVGQTITGTATGIATLRARAGVPDWTKLQALVADYDPVRLVVGLPLNMDDTESDMSAAARRFADRLRSRYGLPVAMHDERLTTREARSLAEGVDDSHALAAALILESWLSENS